MRVFTALNLPAEVKDNLFGIQKHVSSKLAKVNWVAKKNLHITLKFLGDVDGSRLDEVKGRLSEIKFDSSKLKFRDIEFFLKEGKSGIIRLNFYNNKKVEELHKKIDETLLDLFPSSQKFTLHVTLGRIKNMKKKKEFLSKVDSFKFFKNGFEIEGFHLLRSIPIKGRHVYKLIESFKA